MILSLRPRQLSLYRNFERFCNYYFYFCYYLFISIYTFIIVKIIWESFIRLYKQHDFRQSACMVSVNILYKTSKCTHCDRRRALFFRDLRYASVRQGAFSILILAEYIMSKKNSTHPCYHWLLNRT